MSNEFREYIIKERVGDQGYGDCYAAQKKTDSIKKVYILKTLIGNKITGDNIKALQNEIKILEELNIYLFYMMQIDIIIQQRKI